MNIYVGNLPYSVTDESLREMFEPFGKVSTASVIMDRETGRSKGFGFVEMADNAEAQAAIDKLNGNDCGGRALKINESVPRTDRGGSRGGGGGRRMF